MQNNLNKLNKNVISIKHYKIVSDGVYIACKISII